MPARDRTDAVDWSAVEAWLDDQRDVREHLAGYGYELTAQQRAENECYRRNVPNATAALAAVRLVRALEEGRVIRVAHDLKVPDSRMRFEVQSPTHDGFHFAFASTPLAAFQRALDASKGEG